METDTELDIFTALQEAFDVDKECEHPYHTDAGQRMFHGGKAEWYIQVICRDCRMQSGVLAVCDTWVGGAERDMSQCSHCWEVNLTLFLVKERIK